MAIWSILAPVLAGAGASVAGSILGGDEERSEAQRPYTTAEMMPQSLQKKWEMTLANTPSNVRVNFGGKAYPVINKRALQAAMSLYSPAASAGTPLPNPIVSGLQAAMPAIMQALWQPTNVTPAVTSTVPMNTWGKYNFPTNTWF